MVERLEDRKVLADLSGNVAITSGVVNRGQTVDAFWNVTNSDFDTIFTQLQVSFFLSRDSILSNDDRLLSSVTLPPGFPGLFTIPTQLNSLALPGAADSYWGTDTAFQLLMVVDSFGQVFEFNEFNNISTASLTVNSGLPTQIRLNDLPPTNLRPGIVITEMLTALKSHLNTMSKDYSRIANAGRGLVDLSAVISGIKALNSDIGGLVKALKPLLSGRVSRMPFGQDSLTAADLELADRGMVDILMNTFSVNASLLSPAAARLTTSEISLRAAKTARDDDFLDKVRVQIKQTYVDSGIEAFEKTAEAFKKVANWVPGVGQAAAGAAAIATAVGRMLKFGAANIFQGDAETFRRLGSPENTNLVEEYINEAAKEIRDRLPTSSNPGAQVERELLKMYGHAYELSRDLNGSARSIDEKFDELFSRINRNSGGNQGGGNTLFSGKWDGNLFYPSNSGDIGGPMSFTFKKPLSDGTIRGTATLTFNVLDGNVVVDRDISRGNFTMRQTGANTFRGSMTITGRGNTATTEFTARYENGLLIGSLDSNAQSTFTIRQR